MDNCVKELLMLKKKLNDLIDDEIMYGILDIDGSMDIQQLKHELLRTIENNRFLNYEDKFESIKRGNIYDD